MRPSTYVPLFVIGALVAAGCGAASSLESASATTSGSGGSVGAGGSVGTAGSTTSSSGSMGFPLGTFTKCGQGIQHAVVTTPPPVCMPPGCADFLDTADVVNGATLTVAQQGSMLSVTYVGQNGEDDTFTFEPTSDTSAVLAPGGAVLEGGHYSGLCVQGPGDTGGFPATASATAGALVYDGNAMLLSLDGTIAGGDDTPCGASSAPKGIWIVCANDTLPPPSPPGTGGSSAAPELAVGTYACTSLIGSYILSGGENEYAVGGASGTLTVTQSGATVSGVYTGDTFVSGALAFTATTSTTASALPSQTLSLPCEVPVSLPPSPEMLGTLDVEGASLAMTETTLFLSFGGTMASSCPGAEVFGNLLCTKQ